MLMTSQLPVQTTKFAIISFQRALVPPHFEKVPPPMLVYEEAYAVSTFFCIA